MNRNSYILIGLLVSLAANLIVVGFLIGKSHGPRDVPATMAWMTERLSPETQRRIRGRMRAQLSEVRPLREDMRAAQQAVRKAVSAESFDPEALREALKQSREVTARYQALIHKNLVEVSAELPRDQRVALARAALQRGETTKKPPRKPESTR